MWPYTDGINVSIKKIERRGMLAPLLLLFFMFTFILFTFGHIENRGKKYLAITRSVHTSRKKRDTVVVTLTHTLNIFAERGNMISVVVEQQRYCNASMRHTAFHVLGERYVHQLTLFELISQGWVANAKHVHHILCRRTVFV